MWIKIRNVAIATGWGTLGALAAIALVNGVNYARERMSK